MRIRKAKPVDYRKIANLRKKTFEKINGKECSKRQIEVMNKRTPPKSMLEKIKSREMFCITEKERILGVIDLEGNKIGGLFVKHDRINEGIGMRLMEFIEKYAKKQGLKKVKLYSTVYAFPFYKKLGYKLKKAFFWEPEKGVKYKTYEMEKKLK